MREGLRAAGMQQADPCSPRAKAATLKRISHKHCWGCPAPLWAAWRQSWAGGGINKLT